MGALAVRARSRLDFRPPEEVECRVLAPELPTATTCPKGLYRDAIASAVGERLIALQQRVELDLHNGRQRIELGDLP